MAEIHEKDSALLSCDYRYRLHPKSKEYLRHYFEGEVSLALICFYSIFPSLVNEISMREFVKCFTDHTGIYCALGHGDNIVKRAIKLENALKEAEANKDLDLMTKIKSGKLSIS